MKKQILILIVSIGIGMCSCKSQDHYITPSKKQENMTNSKKEQAVALLNTLQSGETEILNDIIDLNKYIQHNLMAADGLEGLKGFVSILPRETTTVDVKRVFQDGDFVFTHVQYNAFGPKIGFDVFRYENDKIVEHWDNLQEVSPPNPSGRSMIDGATALTDLDKTEENKKLVEHFVYDVLLHGKFEKMATYFDGDNYIQHNPYIADQLSGLADAIESWNKQGIVLKYDKIHKVLGEGNFVLVISEGSLAGKHNAFYDLFRVENGKIAEHWDTIEEIPSKDKWKNNNGKF